MKALAGLVLGLVATLALSAEDVARNYADSIAKLIYERNDAALYGEFSPALKRKYSYEQSLELAKELREIGGVITTYSYSKTTHKILTTPQGSLDMTSMWYTVVTSKHPADLFLTIDIKSEDGRLYVVGYGWTTDKGLALPNAPKTPGA